jgi:hypothetical protein
MGHIHRYDFYLDAHVHKLEGVLSIVLNSVISDMHKNHW